MAKYLAMIGDLINSKSVPERQHLQKRMQAVFNEINKKHKKILISNLTLTLGDEFQMIAQPVEQVMHMLDELWIKLDQPFRMGLGYGEIITEINPELSIGADGPAFWNARAAILSVHDNNWNGKNQTRIQGFGEQGDAILNTLWLCTDTLRNQWTQLQKQTFKDLLARDIYCSSFEQKTFSQAIGISETALTRRLNAGNIKIYIHGRRQIGKSMEAWHAEAE